MEREGGREGQGDGWGEREGESKGRKVGIDYARQAESVSGGMECWRGGGAERIDEGNERGRDGTRHGQRDG